MKCTPIDLGNGAVAFVCSRNAPRKRCSCGALTDLLCDYPIGEKARPRAPKIGDCRTNIHNRKVFYVHGVDVEGRMVVVSTSARAFGATAATPYHLGWASWFERTRPGCDKPVCRACVVRLGTLDICAAHGRELARQAKASEG